MSKKDLYAVLDVRPDASPEDIKKAYRRMAMKHHPDRNAGDALSEKAFKDAKYAYEVLSDPLKKKQYDRSGTYSDEPSSAAGRSTGQWSSFSDPGYVDLSDMFSSAFSDFFGAGQKSPGQNAGSDNTIYAGTVEITLEDVVAGVVKPVRVVMPTPCSACAGTGSKTRNVKKCDVCAGNGQVLSQHGHMFIKMSCRACKGASQIPEETCAACSGSARSSVVKNFNLKIPAGIDTETRIKASVLDADRVYSVTVDVEVARHPVFQRDGNRLYCTATIRSTQAALGMKLEIPTLSGKAALTIPPGTQSGQSFRLPGLGLTSMHILGRGDLICQVTVETPINLTKKQRELLSSLEGTFTGKKAAKHSPKSSSFLDSINAFFSRMFS